MPHMDICSLCGSTEDLWQCQTCHEWYCGEHWHDTTLGYCVECVVCEHAREETEEEE